MPNGLKLSDAAANAALDAISALLNGGSLKIYSLGSGVPATTSTAITDQVLLATLPLNATALGAAAGGLANFNAVTQDASADATDTAAFFRLLDSGAVVVAQGLCDVTTSDLNLSSVSFVAGSTVDITSGTMSLG